ncbi:MAG TPA: hypothetical protein VHG89_03135 [Verrucomicrobiae bacterium]|nr:hypothetical protein [Verrucomicrobiae bacterium]
MLFDSTKHFRLFLTKQLFTNAGRFMTRTNRLSQERLPDQGWLAAGVSKAKPMRKISVMDCSKPEQLVAIKQAKGHSGATDQKGATV